MFKIAFALVFIKEVSFTILLYMFYFHKLLDVYVPMSKLTPWVEANNDNHNGVSRLFCNIETRRLKSFSSISRDRSAESSLIANSSLLSLPSCN